ncbi:FMN-binding negative transcriptional regulator [Roseobacter sp. N2S]|uniref:FMN-binding negative transcriptional regulator n=1 Tax=Roseobacter sp. N2S TaxID=2663844 RepID=UPI00285CD738|nr:FMN-binding negative transcriptional regulator [Roseobacter sp. N2S]MDR6263616.1 transcriptional regulator [Roseobacter sp. N2S]
MHPNPVYRKAEHAQNLTFARARGFGVLAVNADQGPLISHIPFQLSEDGTALEGHLVRSNPILRVLGDDGPQQAVIAVSGADSYVSPDWYGVVDQVPTWNYVAVHLRGTLRVLPQDALGGVLERLSEAMETQLLPKPPWTMDKMGEGVAQKMMRMIVPIALDVAEVTGTWKLSQNKPDAVRLGAADGVAAHGIGQELSTLSQWMREPPC